MLARAFAPLSSADGRERRLALAASLAFHAVVIGALIWLFVPSGKVPEATVTIEVAIVGADGAEQPANTGPTQTPPTAQGAARTDKPPPPAARENQPQTAPVAIAVLPPAPSSSDAVLPATPAPAPPSPPASAATATDRAAMSSPVSGTGSSGGASGKASAGAGDAASAGQQGSGEGDHPPRYKLGSGSTPYPPYPMIARRNGYQGRVVVRLEVAADGRTTGAEILQSSGYDVLDQSAVDTLKDWKLEPALAGGRPVPGNVNVPVRFRLSG